MKSKELMVDDWVYAQSSRGEEFYPTKVKNIYDADEDEPCGTIMDNYERIISSYEFKPIPLTEKILKSNGFVNSYTEGWFEMGYGSLNFYYTDKKHFIINSLDDKGNHRKLWVIKIEYVHELQHALRLCELNKLADNFKVEQNGSN